VSAIVETGHEFRAKSLHLALSDIVSGLTRWRTWWVLALNEIRQRYRRSKIGQLWLTLSMAANIAGIGIVFSVVFNQPIRSYLPFLGIGLIIWGLLSALVLDLANAYILSGGYLRANPLPRSTVLFQIILRDTVMFAHNLILIPIIIVVFDIPVTWVTLLFLPGLVLCLINAFWIGLILAPLCARFRDTPQILASIIQLAFFLTPVMFQPQVLRDRFSHLIWYNPFANFLEILRAPLLDQIPDLHHYLLVAIYTVLGFAVAVPFYARCRPRIVYWL
jgi:ABC-type polysaccharide/polyol phosphate export permease